MKLKVIKKLDNAVDLLKKKGLNYTLQICIKRLYIQLYYIILTRDLSKTISPYNTDPNLEIKMIKNREELKSINGFHYDSSVLYEIFDEGCIPFFAYYNHELAGYNWLTKKWIKN